MMVTQLKAAFQLVSYFYEVLVAFRMDEDAVLCSCSELKIDIA